MVSKPIPPSNVDDPEVIARGRPGREAARPRECDEARYPSCWVRVGPAALTKDATPRCRACGGAVVYGRQAHVSTRYAR